MVSNNRIVMLVSIIFFTLLFAQSVDAFCWGTVSSSGYCTGLGTGPNDPGGSNSHGWAVNQMNGRREWSNSVSHDWEMRCTIKNL